MTVVTGANSLRLRQELKDLDAIELARAEDIPLHQISLTQFLFTGLDIEEAQYVLVQLSTEFLLSFQQTDCR